jgi:hypothetical protein
MTERRSPVYWGPITNAVVGTAALALSAVGLVVYAFSWWWLAGVVVAAWCFVDAARGSRR